MVLTVAQVNAFFTAANQMAIPAATVPALNAEGIDGPDDLAEFDEKGIQQVVDGLRKPGDRIPNPDPQAPAGATIPRPPYVLGAKSQKRLTAVSDLVRYYEMTGRPLTAGNIQWDPIVKNFSEQFKALKARRDEDIEVPKLSRALPMLKWVESFTDFLSRKIGVRFIPLAYVVRDEEDVPVAVPALANGMPHSTTHGSVEEEMVARASHGHPLFREDNSKVYFLLEESLRGSTYAPSLKPYQNNKDGRSAMKSVVTQYAGIDKWQAELVRQDEFIHNRRWKGQNNFSLEKFIAQHRNAFVSMTQCSLYVQYQLPNEYTRVGYLLNAIQTSDPKLQAALAVVDGDTDDGGKRNDFEATASYLLPKDPVAARSNKSKGADVSVAHADPIYDDAEISAFGDKPSIGTSGVHLRYHKTSDYNQLTAPQKAELSEWREAEKAKGVVFKKRTDYKKNAKKTGKHKKKGKQHNVSAAQVAKEVAKQLRDLKTEAVDADQDQEELEQFILSVVDKRKHDPAGNQSLKKVRIDETSNETRTFRDGATASAFSSLIHRVKNKSKK